jgi:ABC-2 type transport system permease protein
MLVLIPVFWTHSTRGFDQTYWSLTRFMERPDGLFTGWVRRLITFVLPFALMASFPARYLFDGWNSGLMARLAGVTMVFFGILVMFWQMGLRSYSSASS